MPLITTPGFNSRRGVSFPAIVTTNTSQEGSDVTSHTVDLPSGIVTGNLLIGCFASDGSSSHTWPGGWTKFFDVQNGPRLSLAYRDASGSEGASITLTTGAGQTSTHTTYRISGAKDPAVQAPESSTGATGTSTAPNPDSLTPTGGSNLFLWIAVCGLDISDTGRSVSAAPANYSNLLTQIVDGAGGVGIGTAERSLEATSENPGAFTISHSEGWPAGTIVVHPR